jgi:hypothetical protein
MVRTTEATIENKIISRHPGPPPRGRIWMRPRLTAGSFSAAE